MDILERRSARRADPSSPRPLADSVLRMIWREREISRADIARRAELSRSTVSEIVTALLPTGLVAEVGTAPSSGGRRPIVLQFQDRACVILGVEVGATHVAVALTDLRGDVLAWRHRLHPARTDPKGTLDVIEALCDACLDKLPGTRRRLAGIGVAMPCPIDPRHPERVPELVLPDWGGRSGLERLSGRFGVPLRVDNDANLGALAERWWGAGQGVDDFAYVKLATGVGSGHIIGGRLYRGASGIAGEIGHVVIDPHGAECVCGLRGCLATFVGSQGLTRRVRELLAQFPNSRLAGTELTMTSIEDAALEGDALALHLTRETAEHLGLAVSGLLNVLNPAMVIFGGSLARLGALLLDPLQAAVRRRTLVSSVDASALRMSELGPRAGAIGAATLILESALADSRMFPTSGRAVAS